MLYHRLIVNVNNLVLMVFYVLDIDIYIDLLNDDFIRTDESQDVTRLLIQQIKI